MPKYSDYGTLSSRIVEEVAYSRSLEEARTNFGFPATLPEDATLSAGLAELFAGKIVYQVLPGETGVVDTYYPYGDVRRFGAVVGGSATTNTTAIQNAILWSLGITALTDQVTAQTAAVTLPGMFTTNAPIYCPRYLHMKGTSLKSGITATHNGPILVMGRSLAEDSWLDITLEDFEIHGDVTLSGQHAVQGAWTGALAYAYPLKWKNIYIRDVGGDGIQLIGDNQLNMLIKTSWDNVQVVNAQGYACHIKMGVFNQAWIVDGVFTNCGNGFYVEDIGSGTTGSEDINFQNVQFEALGKSLEMADFAVGSFGFKSTMYSGHYKFDDCYFEGNGYKVGDTTGCNIYVRHPWMLEVTHSFVRASNNLIWMAYGGHAKLEGNFFGALTNSAFTLDFPPVGSNYSNFHIGKNFWDTTYTDAQRVRVLNGAITTVTGFENQRNYVENPQRARRLILRDGITKNIDDGAIGYSAVKQILNTADSATILPATTGLGTIVKDTFIGKLLIAASFGYVAEFLVSSNLITLVGQTGGTTFTVTKDMATSLNVYRDAGLGAWVLQNTTAAAGRFSVKLEGIDTLLHADDGYYEAQFA